MKVNILKTVEVELFDLKTVMSLMDEGDQCVEFSLGGQRYIKKPDGGFLHLYSFEKANFDDSDFIGEKWIIHKREQCYKDTISNLMSTMNLVNCEINEISHGIEKVKK